MSKRYDHHPPDTSKKPTSKIYFSRSLMRRKERSDCPFRHSWKLTNLRTLNEARYQDVTPNGGFDEVLSMKAHPQWLTATEAAAYLRVRSVTLLRWVRCGEVPGHRLFGTKRYVWRFLQSELDGMLTAHPCKSAARHAAQSINPAESPKPQPIVTEKPIR